MLQTPPSQRSHQWKDELCKQLLVAKPETHKEMFASPQKGQEGNQPSGQDRSTETQGPKEQKLPVLVIEATKG